MFDDGVEIGVQLIHLPGNLAAYLNRDDGLHDSRGIHDFTQRSVVGDRGKVLTAAGLLPSGCKGPNRHDDYKSERDERLLFR